MVELFEFKTLLSNCILLFFKYMLETSRLGGRGCSVHLHIVYR